MHAPYFALINLNLKLQFSAKASFSLLLILLVNITRLPVSDSVKQTEARGASKQDVDSEHEEVVAQPADLPIVAQQVEVGDAQHLDQQGQGGGEDHVEGAVVDQVRHRGVAEKEDVNIVVIHTTQL